MAKTHVIDSSENTRVPFLRGILTHSLQDAGLEFEDAYKLASWVRDQLDDVDRINTNALRELVTSELRQRYGLDMATRYNTSPGLAVPIVVKDPDGNEQPFSHERHRHGLESTGLSAARSSMLTDKMMHHLAQRDRWQIDTTFLGRLTYRCLRQDFGKDAARRYLVWQDFIHSGRPLVILIGGTSGCGKSTIATELANRLDIVRTQSTDMLREVMRMMIPERLLPILHKSSFQAWEVLPGDQQHRGSEDRIADGYRSQAELLAVPCEAVLQRAIRERVSLVLEGVHVQPALLDRLPNDSDAVVVPIMLAVLKQEQLRRRFQGRSGKAPARRSGRYLDHFDAIWQLQSLLLSEADQRQVAIVSNDNKDRVMQEIMYIIVDAISEQLNPSLDSVFPK